MSSTAEALPAAAQFVSAAPIYSMTGYASGQGTTDDSVSFSLTFKGVNHRFLDLNLRLPSDTDAVEIALRRMLKERVRRGHIDVTLVLDRRSRDSSQAIQLNRELLAAHIALFREAAAAHGIDAEPSLHEVMRMPGVITSETGSADAGRASALEGSVLAIAPALLEQFNAVRAQEGAALGAELRDSMLRLRTLAREATELRSGAREAHMTRLRTRLNELLAAANNGSESQQPVPDQRLLAEAALLAERSDVEEELVRLRAHVDSFLDMLAAGGELGKRLDFLLQELNREANTLLSKTTGGDPSLGLRLTAVGLEIKTEIERAREQVQNLE